jgi:hypothetical protein
MIYQNKKGEVNPVMLVIGIVVIGLFFFFVLKWSGVFDKEEVTLNVTKLNESASSTATQYVTKAGAVNLTSGKDLTLRNSVENITINDTNKTLIKVIYPNSTLTPGAIMSTNITEICVTGYSSTVRNVSQKLKDTVYIEYKLSPDQPTGAFQIDHLVPLSIGGSNDIKNLWPQPAEPRPGYKEKDVLEKYYLRQVCDGKMDIREAQAMMSRNWLQGYIDAVQSGGIKVNEKLNSTEDYN